MSYDKSAAKLSVEEKEFWYNKAKTCPTLPNDLYDNVYWVNEVSYVIGENPDWPVYKRAVSQAETWCEDYHIKMIVVRCSMTYFILTEKDYKALTSKKSH